MRNINSIDLYELYSLVWIQQIFDNNHILTNNIEYSEKEIYDRIKKYYGNKSNDKDELDKFAKNKFRYVILNMLIEKTLGNSINNDIDKYLFKNINNIDDSIFNTYNNSFSLKLSCLDKDMVISYVMELLMEVDPQGKWLMEYKNMLDNGHVIYINELSELKRGSLEVKLGIDNFSLDNSCVTLPNGDVKLLLNYTGTIWDVFVTVHEFMHYIIFKSNNDIYKKSLLSEFLPMFYELYALDYLNKCGYCREETNFIYQERVNDTKNKMKELSYISNYIGLYLNGIDYDKDNLICDSSIEKMVLNKFNFYDTYSYIFSNYLAIKCFNSDNYLEIIRNSVNNEDYVYKILDDIFGIDKTLVKKKIRSIN